MIGENPKTIYRKSLATLAWSQKSKLSRVSEDSVNSNLNEEEDEEGRRNRQGSN